MIKQIPSDKIKDFIKENPKSILLDVRTKEEWDQIGKPDGDKIGIKTYFLSSQFQGRIINENFVKEFEDLNTIVIGISKDTVEKQIKFKSKYDLKCILGSDVDIKICSKFGVWVEKSMYGKKYMGIQRSTFLISEECKVLKTWPKVRVPNHASEVLEELKKIS